MIIFTAFASMIGDVVSLTNSQFTENYLMVIGSVTVSVVPRAIATTKDTEVMLSVCIFG